MGIHREHPVAPVAADSTLGSNKTIDDQTTNRSGGCGFNIFQLESRTKSHKNTSKENGTTYHSSIIPVFWPKDAINSSLFLPCVLSQTSCDWHSLGRCGLTMAPAGSSPPERRRWKPKDFLGFEHGNHQKGKQTEWYSLKYTCCFLQFLKGLAENWTLKIKHDGTWRFVAPYSCATFCYLSSVLLLDSSWFLMILGFSRLHTFPLKAWNVHGYYQPLHSPRIHGSIFSVKLHHFCEKWLTLELSLHTKKKLKKDVQTPT